MNIIRKHQKLIEENQRLRNQNTAVKAINNALIYRNAELIKCIRLLVEKKKHLETLTEIHLELIAELYREIWADYDAAYKEFIDTYEKVLEESSAPKELTVVVAEQGKDPYVSKVMNDCNEFDRITEGKATTTTDDELPGMAIICNSEKEITTLRMNRIVKTDKHRDYIMGTFIVVGIGERDFVSLTPEQTEQATKRFSLKKA